MGVTTFRSTCSCAPPNGGKGGRPPLGFLALLYWAYWAEHAITWGDPRFGLAVYPLLAAIS